MSKPEAPITDTEQSLLIRIAQCPLRKNADGQLTKGKAVNDDPCSTILVYQSQTRKIVEKTDADPSDVAGEDDTTKELEHVERNDAVQIAAVPWLGHLGNCSILVIMSNPSLWHKETCPFTDDTRDLVAHFNSKFDHTPGSELCRFVPSGGFSKTVMAWERLVDNLSLYTGQKLELGADIALTYSVHCHSKYQIGVREALSECVDCWMDEVISASSANLLVVCGNVALSGLKKELLRNSPVFLDTTICELHSKKLAEATIHGRTMEVLFMIHPTNYHFKPLCPRSECDLIPDTSLRRWLK